MPIYEYACKNCRTKVEKILTVSAATPELILDCKPCRGLTRYLKQVSVPAVVAHKPGNVPNLKMRDVKKPRDKDWKKRVIEGRRADGSRMITARELKQDNNAQWSEAAARIVPDYAEKKQEIKERSNRGEFKGITIKDVVGSAKKSHF